jgi:hypothetical protein
LPALISELLTKDTVESNRMLRFIQSLVKKQSSPLLVVSLVPSVALGNKIGSISIKGELKKVNQVSDYLERQLQQLV